MSTGLNTVAGSIYEDFVEPSLNFKVTENRASQIIKALVVLFGLICVLLVLVIEKLGAILEISASFGGLTSGAILGLFVLGMFFPMANADGAIYGGLASLAVMSWTLGGYRIAFSKGLINYPSLPTSIEGCLFNTTDLILASTETPTTTEEVFPLYKISIFYYSVLGCTVVLVVGLFISYLTGPNKAEDINPDLLSPLIYRFLPENVMKTYRSVPMKEVVVPTNPI